jgi:hypothetical protein
MSTASHINNACECSHYSSTRSVSRPRPASDTVPTVHLSARLRSSSRPVMGTILGPHVMRAGERPARLCTCRTATIWAMRRRDLPKRGTAIYWGSSGRRFKSCQPDTGQRRFW